MSATIVCGMLALAASWFSCAASLVMVFRWTRVCRFLALEELSLAAAGALELHGFAWRRSSPWSCNPEPRLLVAVELVLRCVSSDAA